MSFDLTCFMQAMMTLPGHAELLSRACETAAGVLGQPVFGAHVLPGRAWASATIARSGGIGPTVAVRSALFAIHRRMALKPGPLVLERDTETEPIFRALLPMGQAGLAVLPLRNRTGRLSGVLAGELPDGSDSQERLRTLETIAGLTGLAMEAAWLHMLARKDQERLQLFSETTQESLWDWNIALGEVWWGGDIERLFGGKDRVSARPDWRRLRVHADDKDRIVASFDGALAGDDSAWHAQYRLRIADDDILHVREHVYFLRDADGQAYRAIGTVRDVSALEQSLRSERHARETAERAGVVKDEFLAMLGHELRNPLAPIVTAISLLERQVDDPARAIHILRRQTQHLVRLVDDLLDVSRISTGKIELHRQCTPVAPLIHRALEMAHPLLEQRQHRVSLDLAPGIEVDVDPGRIVQVISNLLTNAAKFTEPGGHVQVGCRVEAERVAIRVRDSGIGLAAEFLPTIFEMFTQGPQAIDRAQAALGLGLNIVANIIKLHGGSVEAHSDGPGQGTEIIVRLPVATGAPTLAPAAARLPGRASKPRDLLVIDDNEDAASMLHDLLAANGHVVRVAHHPDDAIRMFADRRPDVALVDIGLPAINGYELVRRLRSHDNGARTTFVALTGYGLAADKARALEAGFADHLVKPVALERLERLLEDGEGR